ncbi:MAG: T9SS type A sorting domain-containing protein [Saprospiraceae bacterium]|nr:T9SS type A sorting domain-containing protein [Saprospiraceae bacterium]
MRLISTLTLLLVCLALSQSSAQTPRDYALPLTASLNLFPPSISLSWPNPSGANLQLLRRTKGQTGNQWIQLFNVNASNMVNYSDNNISVGQTYEYVLVRNTTFSSIGYAHVGVRAPVVDNRGKILVIIDSTSADALGVELVRMKNDMRGDGWVVEPHKIGPSATVASVKSLIVNSYNADQQNVKAVLLMGAVPVPYSGNTAWDGHTDQAPPIHTGAWPADVYYGDVNGLWTDNVVNNTTPARDANDNVPGDGKFDQDYVPTQVELQVGRIDFRRINAPQFGEADAIGLMRRYLDKNHAWRTGAYQVENKAIVDDNFGFVANEFPFAMNGYRNPMPLMPEANIVDGDFFNNTNPESYLMGYGCGPGGYSSAGGVGSSSNFATDTVNVVFANLFGSYFGDWDYESNPLMPSALASRGGILTCSWAARPHYFYHPLASGETIGYCTRETQNAQFNNGFYATFGESSAQVSLLGDPTIRAHIVPPPNNVAASNSCTRVQIAWNSPSSPVDGYHVYRSLSNDGPYVRLTTNLLSDTIYFDNNPIEDTLFYQVRAIKSTSSPAGGLYSNNSVGPITYVVYTAGTPPTVQVSASGELTCINTAATLTSSSNSTISSYEWSGPDGYFSTDPSPSVTDPGNYALVVSDASGCTATASVFVSQNTIQPVSTIISSNPITCAETSALLSVTSSSTLNPNGFTWSTGATTNTLEVTASGTYSVTVTDWLNGCTGTAVVNQTENTTPPNLGFPTEVTYNCFAPCVLVNLPLPTVYAYQFNGAPVAPGVDLMLCNAGVFDLVTTDRENGCSSTTDIEVIADVNEPGAQIGGNTQLSCSTPSIQLLGSTNSVNSVIFLWTGPGINANNANQQSPTINQAGLYTLLVTDEINGCTSTATVTITSDQSLPVAIATGGALTCLNTEVTLSSEGSTNTPTTTYFWTGPGLVSIDPNPETSTPGTYTLIVNNGNGCTAVATAVVTQDITPPSVTFQSIGSLTCNVDCIELAWSPVSNNITVEPVEFCDPGSYTVTITNTQNGCTSTNTFAIVEVPTLSGEFEPQFIDCDGTVTLTIVPLGGLPPYTYLWSNGSTLQSALYILDGTPISVSITDAAGCSWGSQVLNIVAPPPVVVNSSITDETAPGAANGSINLTVSGGTPPFIFNWSNGATTEDVSGLTGGTYTVVVTEVTTGCTSEYSFTVNTSVGTGEAGDFKTIQLAPNPTTGVSALTLEMKEAREIRVEIRDALGRLIVEHAPVQTDMFNWNIDLSKHAAGIYQVSIITGDKLTVRSLVIAR